MIKELLIIHFLGQNKMIIHIIKYLFCSIQGKSYLFSMSENRRNRSGNGFFINFRIHLFGDMNQYRFKKLYQEGLDAKIIDKNTSSPSCNADYFSFDDTNYSDFWVRNTKKWSNKGWLSIFCISIHIIARIILKILGVFKTNIITTVVILEFSKSESLQFEVGDQWPEACLKNSVQHLEIRLIIYGSDMCKNINYERVKQSIVLLVSVVILKERYDQL